MINYEKKLISLFLLLISLEFGYSIPTQAAENKENSLVINKAFRYHDNYVKFNNNKKFRIINGNFTIDSCSITPGQDKNGNYSYILGNPLRMQNFDQCNNKIYCR